MSSEAVNRILERRRAKAEGREVVGPKVDSSLEIKHESDDPVKRIMDRRREQGPATIDTTPKAPEEEKSFFREMFSHPKKMNQRNYKEKGKLGKIASQFQIGGEETGRAMDLMIAGQKGGRRPEYAKIKAVDFPKPRGFLEGASRVAGEWTEPIFPGTPPGTSAPLKAIQAIPKIGPGLMKGAHKVGKVAKNLIRKGKPIARDLTSKTYGLMSEVLATIPHERATKALKAQMSGKSLWDGKQIKHPFARIGERIQEGYNKALKNATDQLQKAEQTLRDGRETVRIDDVLADAVDQLKMTKFGEVEVLTKQDRKIIDNLLYSLMPASDTNPLIAQVKGHVSLADMQGVKKKADNAVIWSLDPMNKMTDQAQFIIKRLSHNLNAVIRAKSPILAKANDAISRILNAHAAIKTEMKPKSIATKLRNFDTVFVDDASRDINGLNAKDALKELDAIFSPKYKFWDDVDREVTKKYYKPLWAGLGGGSGSGQGLANLARASAIVPFGPLFSPMAHRGTMKNVPKAYNRIAKEMAKAGKLPGIKQTLPVAKKGFREGMKRVPKSMVGRETLYQKESEGKR